MKIFDTDYVQPKAFTGGTHRTRPPRETVEAYRPLMPRLGITRLANVTGLDYVGIPVWMCVRPNSRIIAVSQGKGLDHDAAKASALMESIECWHAERIALPTRLSSYDDLRRDADVVDVFSMTLHQPRAVPTGAVLAWVEGYDVALSRRVWVPFETADLDTTWARDEDKIFEPSSNGLASGNHVLEAIVHGLCEVIERDAVALWSCDRSDPTGGARLVDPASVDDPACRTVLDAIEAAGLFVGIQDVTSDVEVPSYQCQVVEPPGAGRPAREMWGSGTHLSPGIALLRALTEAVQARLTVIAGSRDDLLLERYARGTGAGDLLDIIDQLQNQPRPVRFDTRPSIATESFEGDIAVMVARLRNVGLPEVVVVDLSRPDVGVPVVKVVVPGLEAMTAPQFTPGRRAREALARGEV